MCRTAANHAAVQGRRVRREREYERGGGGEWERGHPAGWGGGDGVDMYAPYDTGGQGRGRSRAGRCRGGFGRQPEIGGGGGVPRVGCSSRRISAAISDRREPVGSVAIAPPPPVGTPRCLQSPERGAAGRIEETAAVNGRCECVVWVRNARRVAVDPLPRCASPASTGRLSFKKARVLKEAPRGFD